MNNDIDHANDNRRIRTSEEKICGYLKASFHVETLASGYLHAFREKLGRAGIVTIEDVTKYTEEELFALAPTSEGNKERIRQIVRDLGISFKPPKPNYLDLVM